MYQDLGKALRRRFGARRRLRVVEDGDRAGYKSARGIAAKAKQRITAWTLPPKSPGLMPLDYSLWREIELRTWRQKGRGRESKARYAARLRRTALSLPRPLVRRVLAQMRPRLMSIVRSRGKDAKLET